MHRADHPHDLPCFYLPFGAKPDPDNRWARFAKTVPWHLVVEGYRANFA